MLSPPLTTIPAVVYVHGHDVICHDHARMSRQLSHDTSRLPQHDVDFDEGERSHNPPKSRVRDALATPCRSNKWQPMTYPHQTTSPQAATTFASSPSSYMAANSTKMEDMAATMRRH